MATRDEFIDVLPHTWSEVTCHHDARFLWMQIMAQSPPPDSVLKAPSRELFLNGLSLGTFLSPGDYRSHWSSPFCATVETLMDAAGTAESDSGEEEDCSSSNRLSALFEHDTESLSVVWKRSHGVRWRMEIAYDSLADRVLVVARQGRTVHLFMFLASQPRIYRGKTRPGAPPPAFRRRFLDSVDASRVEWERECRFETCDRRTFGACDVLHLKLAARTRHLNTLVRRLELTDFAVYYGNPMIVDVEQSGEDAPWPTFQTFDASYAWFCLQTRGFKVLDQARSAEFVDLLTAATTNPQLDRILDAVASRVDEWLICDLRRAFVEELELVEKTGRTSEDPVLKPAGDQFVSIRRLLVTPTTVRGLSAQWGVGNRVVRHYGSDRFVRVIIRDEDLSLLSAAHRLRRPIGAITDFLGRDLVIADRRYHFLGCSNSQLREHGLWMYAGDGREGHSVDAIRRWMGDLTRERCVATYMSRLGQFFSASRNTIEVDRVEMIPDVERGRYCFTDGIGKISPMLARKVTTVRNFSLLHHTCRILAGWCADPEVGL